MRLRRHICFLWILGEEAERWLVVAVGSWVQDIDLFLLRSSPVSLCSRGEETLEFAGGLVLELCSGSCRSCARFKGRLSVPPEWPLAKPLHFRSSLLDPWRRILAARVLVRRFSTTSGVVAIHIDAWSSFTSQHHLGLLELSGGVRDKFCAGSGLQGKEYGVLGPCRCCLFLWAEAKKVLHELVLVDGADLVKLRVNGFGLSCLPRFRLDRVSV
ncbi:hypothetical protein YC2023_046208 [Brassica napus]